MDAPTRRLPLEALDKFEWFVKPVKMPGVKTEAVHEYAWLRSKERGKKPGSQVTPTCPSTPR